MHQIILAPEIAEQLLPGPTLALGKFSYLQIFRERLEIRPTRIRSI